MAKKQKVLQNDSIFNELDVDGDGVITDEEMKQAEELMRLEQERERFKNEDAKEDQIRAMAWFALWGMLLYPVLILITSLVGVDTAAKIIGDIAPTYFVAIAGLVAAFFGAQAYTKGKGKGGEMSMDVKPKK
tara:strand:- start:1261 stop:1656 length:396 start_codon:yes stop_codon:yes gene_type:complete